MSDNKKKRIDKVSVPQKPLKARKDLIELIKGSVPQKWSEPLRLDTLSLNTPYIPENYSLPATSRIPLEADTLKRNATSSYYTHLQ